SLRVSWPLLRVAEDVPGGRTRRYRRKAKASRMGRPGEVETGPTARGYSEHFIRSEPHPSVTHHLPPSTIHPRSVLAANAAYPWAPSPGRGWQSLPGDQRAVTCGRAPRAARGRPQKRATPTRTASALRATRAGRLLGWAM